MQTITSALMGYNLDEIQGKHHRIFVTKEVFESAEYKDFGNDLKRTV